jgi:LacI family transcriptional regulator
MTTSRDIARRAGVSQTTVSRVLNGSEKVSPATRERVLAALEGYRPNAQARAMRTQRTDSIGVVASQITNPYFPELLDSLYRTAETRGKRILLWNDPDPWARSAIDGARGGFVDGICYASAMADAPGVQSLVDLGIPLVLVNRGLEVPITDQVTSDSPEAGRMVARYFLDGGRRRPAIVMGDDGIHPVHQRRTTFLQSIADAGIEIPPRWRYTGPGPMTFDDGVAAATRLLSEEDRPDAVFCGNDLMAFGFLSACRRAGVRVPEDIWVVGTDDLPMAAWEAFDLTTVRQPIADMAELAVDFLLERIEGLDVPLRDRQLPVSLVVRGSTGNVPA